MIIVRAKAIFALPAALEIPEELGGPYALKPKMSAKGQPDSKYDHSLA
jgi:hypothetical protein